MDLSGKIAVITGGGGGLGAAMAHVFAAAGAAIAAVDIDESAAETTATAIAAEFAVPTTASRVDIGDIESVTAAARHVRPTLGG